MVSFPIFKQDNHFIKVVILQGKEKRDVKICSFEEDTTDYNGMREAENNQLTSSYT